MTRSVLFLVFMVSIVFAFTGCGDGEQKADEANTGPQAVAVERGSLLLAVESTGRVVPALDVDITSMAGGEVVKVTCDVSDKVKEGDLLLEINPVYEERTFRKAEASVDAAKAKVARSTLDLEMAKILKQLDIKQAKAELSMAQAEEEDAKAKANRTAALYKEKRVSQEENETAQLTYRLKRSAAEKAAIRLERVQAETRELELKAEDVKLAKTALVSEEQEFEKASQRMKDTKVFAPMAGTVSARIVQPGQIISSAMNNVGGGTNLMTISDLSHLFIVASVDESDIGKVVQGCDVTITVDAYPDVKFEGKVVRIATKGENTSNVVTFEVKIEVTGKNRSMLKPEMTANVSIIVARRENVLCLPSDAVRRRRSKTYVIMAPPESVKAASKTNTSTEGKKRPDQRPVEVGVDDGKRIEIISGLAEGDKVLMPDAKSGQWARRSGDSAGRMGQRMMMQGMRGGGRR